MPSYTRRVEIPGKSSQELYDKVSNDIERFIEKASIGKVDIERNPSGKQISFKSSMVSGSLSCKEGSIQVDCKLSLLAAPFRGKLDEGINKWLTKAFNIGA